MRQACSVRVRKASDGQQQEFPISHRLPNACATKSSCHARLLSSNPSSPFTAFPYDRRRMLRAVEDDRTHVRYIAVVQHIPRDAVPPYARTAQAHRCPSRLSVPSSHPSITDQPSLARKKKKFQPKRPSSSPPPPRQGDLPPFPTLQISLVPLLLKRSWPTPEARPAGGEKR